MKKEGLKASFDPINPDESAKKRMLGNILNYRNEKKGNFTALFYSKKAIPALALTVVIAGSFITYGVLSGRFNYKAPPEYISTDNAGQGREDAVAPLMNQFQIGDKHYIALSDEQRADFGLPAAINEGDTGEKITVITNSPDKSLVGKEVYSYIPAGGEAIVAVKMGDEYKLFRFFTFESYNNNQDEDAVEYLTLYGIDKADDIAKIQFIGHSEESKLQGRTDIIGEIADRDEINEFYGFYSALRNSSDKYFDRLFNYSGTAQGSKGVEADPAAPDSVTKPDAVIPPDAAQQDIIVPDQTGYGRDMPADMESEWSGAAEDMPLVITDNNEAGAVTGNNPVSNETPVSDRPSGGIIDTGDTGAGSVEPSKGSAGEALANPVTVRIYNRNGIYYDSVYYMNIGFINRYEVSKDFADFMGKYLNR